MNYEELTKEQKEELFQKLEAEKRAEKQKKEEDREAYKSLKDEAIEKTFKMLLDVSEVLLTAKEETFKTFEQIIAMKDDLFNSKSERSSNTFTTDNGMVTIKMGNRTNEGWDDTVEIGVERVKKYLHSLAKDEDSGNLVDTVMRLISKDRKGNLKASKVIELEQLAMKTRNEDFIEAIQLIKAAYRPTPSCQFIEVRFRDKDGNEHSLPLSMSAI